MFYFMLAPKMIYNVILIAAAVIPAVFLMIKVYRSDKLEKESGHLLFSLMKAGIFSSLIALVEEKIGSFIISLFAVPGSLVYDAVMFFLIVAVSEESSKYIMLKRNTWRNPEFNCQYDGVVYAVFVSLGFALWENISYVLNYGFATALVRAVTAIPGHACFGVFMGVFYGIAKKLHNRGNESASGLYRFLCVAVPVLLHGAYDFIATRGKYGGGFWFIPFVAVLFIISFILTNKASKKDKYIA